MRKPLCIGVILSFLLLVGCGVMPLEASEASVQPEKLYASPTAYVSGMGCSDPSCTDATHHHDCPADCTEYDHYHNCDLGCNETSHHHGGSTVMSGHGKHHENGHH